MTEAADTRNWTYAYVLLGAVTAGLLLLVRERYSYALFHLLVEMFAIAVAAGTFMVAWNTRKFMDNGYIVFMGIVYFFVASIDLVHAVSYKGMNLIPGANADLPTQLWVAARYLQASAILIAPFFVDRKVRPALVAWSYALASALLIALVGADLFPTAFVEGAGLTPFKIYSEYLIVLLMIGGLILLQTHRKAFDDTTLRLLAGSIVASIAAELAFTLYVDVYGVANFAGHLLRVLAYFFLYRAVIESALARPYEVLFRRLAATADDLREREGRLRSTFEETSMGVAHVGIEGSFSAVNPRFEEIVGYTEDQLTRMRPEDLTHPDDRIEDVSLTRRMLEGALDEAQSEMRFTRSDGEIIWVRTTRNLLRDTTGKPHHIVIMAEDITARRSAEAELRTERDLNAALTSIAETVLSTLDVEELLTRRVERAGEAIGAESAAVVVRESRGWVVRHAYRFPEEIVGEAFPDDAVRHGIEALETNEPVAIDDAFQDERVNQELMHRYNIKSVIAIPLRFREEQVGTLYLMYHSARHNFTDIEREFARRLASMLSLSVENTRLYQAEREIADTLQAALLTTPETIEGLDIAHSYRSASALARIGGDFFDVFRIRPGVAAVLIGDVSGKGLEAATFTAMARGSIRAFTYSDDSPASVLTAANRAIVRQTGDVRFVTAVLMTIDIPRGLARICCAGHPAPILCHPDGCEADSAVRNPPLGVMPDLQFEGYELLLTPGDRLVFFTDGLIDARHEGSLFGIEGVRRVLDELGDADPANVVDSLLAEADAHARGSSADDVASIVVRYTKGLDD